MGFHSILHFLEDRAILVTGATGFIGKVFIEKILRVQPKVKKVYLLLRAADQISAEKRFKNEVIAKDLFRMLKKKYEGDISTLILDKVRVVCGDVAFENLGVKDHELLREMWEQVDVVVHLAANTNFIERYDVSLQTNTLGVMHVLSFCKRCNKFKILVHVSTAYVSIGKEGLILETPHKMGEALNGEPGLDVFEEKKLIEQTLKKLRDENCSQGSIKAAMRNLGIERANKFGWPTTYLFTKAMGEMVLGEMKGDIPFIIIRPTIVTTTYKEPFPGWIEGVGMVDNVLMEYGKGNIPPCFLVDPNTVLDMIPADMVVNAMIVAMSTYSNQPNQGVIYHVSSFGSNPFFAKWVLDFAFSYFTRNPWINTNRQPIIVERVVYLSTRERFQEYMRIHYGLQLKELKIVDVACTFEDYGKMKSFVNLIELSEPFCLFRGMFSDTNVEKLRRIANESGIETDIFYFDPKAINWEDYYINTHIPTAVKYNYSLLSRI